MGTLLLCLALAPMVAFERGPVAALAGDQRMAMALIAAEVFVGAPSDAGQRRITAGRSGEHGPSPLRVSGAAGTAEGGGYVGATIRVPRLALLACRPHAERLPYHAMAPPPASLRPTPT